MRAQHPQLASIWAIVVAGGSGTRFGEPKQLAQLGDRRVIDWALDAVRPHVGGTVAVLPAEFVVNGRLVCETDQDGLDAQQLDATTVVAGGASRSASVRAGLAQLPPEASHVLVHDAARPLADSDLIGRVVAGLADADAVVPVTPVTDTLRHVDGGTVDRSELVAVQTPQGFDVDVLRRAHTDVVDATDDAGLVDSMDLSVLHVEGDPVNLKITVAEDLVVAEALLAHRRDGGPV